jgi:5'(3')-deoxyribonucleotidase
VKIAVPTRIAIDMDEVLADTLSKALRQYNSDLGLSITKQDLAGKKLRDVIPEVHRRQLEGYPHDPGFFRDIDVMPGAQEVVKQLATHFEVFVVSAAMEYPSSFGAKFDWVQEHFPFIPARNIVFCGSKSIVTADFLIDDHVHHLEVARAQGLLFEAPHNVNEAWTPRLKSWEDVAQYFLK